MKIIITILRFGLVFLKKKKAISNLYYANFSLTIFLDT